MSALTKGDIAHLRLYGRSAAARNEDRCVLVEGRRAIEGAHRAGAIFKALYSSDEKIDISLGTDVEVISQKNLERIATTDSPQNVIALCEMPIVHPDELSREPLVQQPVLVLDQVSDPGNVGTIIRSSVAFSMGAVVLVGGCDPYHPKVVRSSAGSVFASTLISLDEHELDGALGQRPIYVATSDDASPLALTTFAQGCAVVLGNEAHGVITPFFRNNTHSFTIPMSELCESLNVAMTATLVAHHINETRKS